MLKVIEYFELNEGIFDRPAVAGFTNGLPQESWNSPLLIWLELRKRSYNRILPQTNFLIQPLNLGNDIGNLILIGFGKEKGNQCEVLV